MKDLFKLFICFSLAISHVGCGGEPALSTIEGGTTNNTTNPPEGVTQEVAAYVRVVDENKFDFHMGKYNAFGEACEIRSGSAAGQMVECLVDVNELDVYYHGLSLQANFPSSMCKYVVHNPHWHYNDETGYGPENVSITKTTLNGTVTGTTCLIDGDANCDSLEATYSATDGLTCKYDHRKSNGPNCCLDNIYTGKYTYSVTTNEVGSTPSTTTTTSQQSWGGNVQNCLGGQGRTNWTLYTKNGYPAGEIKYVENIGYNKISKISPVMTTSASLFSLPIANNYKRYNASSPPNHRHTGYVETRSTDLPYMVDPVDDRNGTKMTSGNPAYSWYCLDQDDEVIHAINVYVREWNTLAQYNMYIATSGASGDPDVTGAEGSGCDYNSGSSCDDYIDMDIIMGPYTSANRFMYFPAVPYK